MPLKLEAAYRIREKNKDEIRSKKVSRRILEKIFLCGNIPLTVSLLPVVQVWCVNTPHDRVYHFGSGLVFQVGGADLNNEG